MKKSVSFLFVFLLIQVVLISCSEHSGENITKFSGDYRYMALNKGKTGIAEFFNCADRKRYFVHKSGAYKELKQKYLALKLGEKEDAYLKVRGYLKQEILMEGIDPVTVFVAVEFTRFDKNRGCELASSQY